MVLCIDATEAKQHRARARAAPALHARADRRHPEPALLQGPEGRYRVYNRAWDELFGQGRDWKGKTVHDLFEPSIAAEHHDRDRGLLERPGLDHLRVERADREGDVRQMLYNKVSFVDQRGEVAGLIGVITDVTRYKETERALEASEARFRVLTESSLDLISVVDAEGKILYQSPALRQLLGYEASETLGSNVMDMVHRDDVEGAQRGAAPRDRQRHSSEPAEFGSATRTACGGPSSRSGTNCLRTRTSTAWCSTRAT
jgi:PAS domain S-box-containing protein